MAAKIYYQEDCNLSLLEGQKIAIIGYGSQGHAHALNLKESGCDVIIGLYEGSKSWAKAEAQGFKVYTAAEADVTADQAKEAVIAYEPIWAIGTGKTATSDQAEEVCAAIRACIAEVYDDATAAAIRIQYGGSMNAGNAAELLAKPDIDGGLVGGASLKVDFGQIVNYNK